MTKDKARKTQSLSEIMGKYAIGNINQAVRANGKLSTGLVGLDRAMGGGIPRGQVTQVVGKPKAGKTTLMLQILKNAQKTITDRSHVFIDTEHRLNRELAESIGVDMDSLMYAAPESGEAAVEIIMALIHSREVGVIVLDSIGMLVPQARLESEVGKALPAIRARLVGELMERATAPLSSTNTTLLCINHLTGTMNSYQGHEIQKPKGGQTLEYATSSLLHVKRVGRPEMDGDDPIGYDTTVKIEKNTYGKDGVEVPLFNFLGKGFDPIDDLVNTAVRLGVVRQAGAWVYYGEEKFNGKAKLVEALTTTPELYTAISDAVRQA